MKEERIIEVIDSLIEDNETMPVIVEGKRDEIALRKIGLKGEILRFNLGMSMTGFCEFIIQNYKKVILLFDWDKKGNNLLSSMEKILISNGVMCDIEKRNEIQSIVGNSIRSVEEIYPFYILSLEKLTLKNFKRSPKIIRK
ncbi:MAG: toprim domain-containing protein [Thermoplasmata archaeon]